MSLVMAEDNLEIPEYFMCPISLQIMKDPVTAATGITYDRESIEHWLLKEHNTLCPVTKLPLPEESDQLTPNHTLRRLIQSWCTANNNATEITIAPNSPKPSLSKFYVLNLIRNLWLPNSQLKSLKDLERLASESERNRKHMVEAGVAKPILSIIVTCYRKGEITSRGGLEEALSILYLIRNSLIQTKIIAIENHDEIIDALTWVLGLHDHHDRVTSVKTNAVSALRIVTQKAHSGALGRLKPELFKRIVTFLRSEGGSAPQRINPALHVMLDSSPWGRNRIMMVEAGAVFELIEIELKCPEKKTTELILGVLFHLCSCADGRAEFLSHAGGVAVVTWRILKISPAADDRAMLILSLICKFSATNEVLQEMLRVGAVAKLCMVLQANCVSYLKDKAREILRTHSNVWKNSPCVEIPSLTSYVY